MLSTVLACLRALVPIVGILCVLNPFSRLGISLYTGQYLAVVLALLLALVFLDNAKKVKASNVISVILTVASLAIGVYVAWQYPRLILTVGLVTPIRALIGTVLVLLVLEAARRVVGHAFLIISVFFIVYALLASKFPGPLKGTDVPPGSLAVFLFLDPQAIYGLPLEIASTTVLCFVLFGQFVSKLGIGEFFSCLAEALMGKYRGGPAKVAVVSSSLFGMISGSAVANVVTTGTFTIPTMIRSGYPPYFAAAVEAVSSTGGQIMPPIMGAAAFLMATFLGIPYPKIALSAFAPALLYYLAVFLQVDLRAGKLGLRGIPKGTGEDFLRLLRDRYFLLIPVITLVVILFGGRRVEESALLSAVVCIAIGFVWQKRLSFSSRSILLSLKDAGSVMVEVGVTSAAAGVIIGVLSMTGLGYNFSSIMVSLAGGNKPILLCLAAATAVILGMGMTVTAAYLLTVALAAPALIQLGLDPLVAHFFVFYYAVLSFLTPPVCLAAYAAAAIANARMSQVALNSMKLGIVAYIVPFVIAYEPYLLLKGDLVRILWGVAMTSIGICLLCMGVERYFMRPLSLWKSVLAIAAGLLLFSTNRVLNLLGICLGVYLMFAEVKGKQKGGQYEDRCVQPHNSA